ncbi:uncharacterized protein LOC116306546, partial [Actinia tenebrosa]|uniref:Uncharacterized protein LOC116306546 n=1 Tax=Actinia tenebrosa TaxID=6105 RepID=A0A6P8J4R2_ACTTE
CICLSTPAGPIHAQEQQLDLELRKFRGHAFAQSTAATYKSQLRCYIRFCVYFGYAPVPCKALHLLRYIVFLTRTLSPTSIPCYLNVIRILHLQYGFPNPLQEPLFKYQKELLMRGIKRLKSNPAQQKLPITPTILKQLYGHLDIGNSMDATFWAACLVAFFSFFRKSNLLILSGNAFDPQKHLRAGDIRIYEWGLMLIVRWSKTIQYRNRILLVPVPRIDGSTLCPRAAIINAFELSETVFHYKTIYLLSFTKNMAPLTCLLFLYLTPLISNTPESDFDLFPC